MLADSERDPPRFPLPGGGSYGRAHPVVLPDLNRDGLPELAVGWDTGTVWILDGATWPSAATETPVVAPWATLQLPQKPNQLSGRGATTRAVHDIDGDGVPDLLLEDSQGVAYLVPVAHISPVGVTAVAEAASLIIRVLPPRNDRGAMMGPACAIGDMTGDGIPEVAYTSGNYPSTTHIIDGETLGSTTGTHDVASLSTWTAPHRLRGHGDVDGDGKMDLLLSSMDYVTEDLPGGGTRSSPANKEPLVIHLAAGLQPGGGASTQTRTTGRRWMSTRTADVDGSGADDLVVTAYNKTTMRFETEIFLDPGLGGVPGATLQPHITLADRSPLMTLVVSAHDLDGDGNSDLLIDRASSAGPFPDGSPSVLLSPL